MTTAPTTETEPIATEPPPTGVIGPATGALSLRKNFSWTFVGNVVYAGCQWGILVVLAKLGTPEMVGQFALGLAITAPVMMFSMLQLRGVQATDAKREYQFGDYLALRLITTALALAVIVGIVAVSSFKRETALVILIVGAMKGVDALSDVYYGLWQQNERMDGIAQALMLNGVLSTAALTAIMAATHNIVLAVLGTATGSVGALAFTLFHNCRLALATGQVARPNWNTRLLWRLTRLALPLGAAALFYSLDPNIPKYVIEYSLGSSQLGIFTALVYLIAIGSTIVSALGQSMVPRLAQHHAAHRMHDYSRLLFRVLGAVSALGISILVISVLFGRDLLNTVYRAEYGAEAGVLVWVALAGVFVYVGSILNFGMTAGRRFAEQMFVIFGSVIVTSALGCLLIPKFGLYGAAWTGLIGAAFQVIATACILMGHVSNRYVTTERGAYAFSPSDSYPHEVD